MIIIGKFLNFIVCEYYHLGTMPIRRIILTVLLLYFFFFFNLNTLFFFSFILTHSIPIPSIYSFFLFLCHSIWDYCLFSLTHPFFSVCIVWGAINKIYWIQHLFLLSHFPSSLLLTMYFFKALSNGYFFILCRNKTPKKKNSINDLWILKCESWNVFALLVEFNGCFVFKRF